MIPPLLLGEVDIEVSNKDWVHAIWAVAECYYHVIGLICAAQQDVSPDDEMPLLPHCHM